jgi:DNA-binding GntR family transcriptional regulator
MNDTSYNRKKYQAIEKDVIDKIGQGIYTPNNPLPTEAEFTKMFDCSRVTVRQALSNLVTKGYITKTQGSRSFVNGGKMFQKSPLIKSFTDDMEALGKTPSTKVISFSITEAGAGVAHLLGIKASDSVYYIERTRHADGVPVMFEKTFMSVTMHPDLTINALMGSKLKYGEDHGMIVEYTSQNITPVFPTLYIANELGIPETEPILRITNVKYLEDNRIFDYEELYINTELYQINIIKRRK